MTRASTHFNMVLESAHAAIGSRGSFELGAVHHSNSPTWEYVGSFKLSHEGLPPHKWLIILACQPTMKVLDLHIKFNLNELVLYW